ncbi:hypothetical protein TNCV_568321 [Trichonephila clavipes]|nr:hypothetical protein TNCV_568321 [Trichonephila clavipes]
MKAKRLQIATNVRADLLNCIGHGSRVVYVSDRGLPCHEFEPSTTKYPPCRAAMHRYLNKISTLTSHEDDRSGVIDKVLVFKTEGARFESTHIGDPGLKLNACSFNNLKKYLSSGHQIDCSTLDDAPALYEESDGS